MLSHFLSFTILSAYLSGLHKCSSKNLKSLLGLKRDQSHQFIDQFYFFPKHLLSGIFYLPVPF